MLKFCKKALILTALCSLAAGCSENTLVQDNSLSITIGNRYNLTSAYAQSLMEFQTLSLHMLNYKDVRDANLYIEGYMSKDNSGYYQLLGEKMLKQYPGHQSYIEDVIEINTQLQKIVYHIDDFLDRAEEDDSLRSSWPLLQQTIDDLMKRQFNSGSTEQIDLFNMTAYPEEWFDEPELVASQIQEAQLILLKIQDITSRSNDQ